MVALDRFDRRLNAGSGPDGPDSPDTVYSCKRYALLHQNRILEMMAHVPRRIVRESIRVIDLVQLFLINRLGRRPVTEHGGPVVSLTTHGKRSQKVYYAIESIARGNVRPSRLILWIDDEALLKNLPATIRRLQKRGLEVKPCRNYGPHTKYYPYVESNETFNTPLVTADDDILYPRYLLQKLIEANREYPDTVNCYTAFWVDVGKKGIGKYKDWIPWGSTRPYFRNFALGVMGVIYPPAFLTVLKRAGTTFEDSCPKGDDLWLHVQALRSGYRVRQIFPRLPYFSFQEIPGTQKTNLRRDNIDHGDGNDRQIAATYNEADVQLLRSD